MTNDEQDVPLSLRVRQWVLSQPIGTRFTMAEAMVATGISHGPLGSALHFLVKRGGLRAVRSVREPGKSNRYTYEVLTGTDPVRPGSARGGRTSRRGPDLVAERTFLAEDAPVVAVSEPAPLPEAIPAPAPLGPPDDVIAALGRIVPVPRPDPQQARLVGVLLAAAGMAGATADDFFSAALTAEVSQ